MSFKSYVATRRITDTPSGDFVADARRDHQLPDATTWEDLRAYLFHNGACREAIAAARVVWADYVAKLRRKSKNA
jgi:hypothetical protein